MSSLPDRRDAPRRRMRASGMHPGWACFFAAFGAGLFTAIATAAGIRWMQGWDRADMLIVVGGIAVALLLVAGRKAEKLMERD